MGVRPENTAIRGADGVKTPLLLLNKNIQPDYQPYGGDGTLHSRILSTLYTAAEVAHAFSGFPKVYFLALPIDIVYLKPSLNMLFPTVAGIVVSGTHVVFSKLATYFPNNTSIQYLKTGVGFCDDVILESIEKTGLLFMTGLRIAAVIGHNKTHSGLLIPNIVLPMAVVLGSLYGLLVAGKYSPYLLCPTLQSVDDDFMVTNEHLYPSHWQDIIKECLDAFGSCIYSFLVLEKFGLFPANSLINLLSPAIPMALFFIICLIKNHYFVASRALIMILDFLKNLSLGAAVLDFGFSLYAATHKNKISTAFIWGWGSLSTGYTLLTCLTVLGVQIYIVGRAENYDAKRLAHFAEALVRKFSRVLLRPIDQERMGGEAYLQPVVINGDSTGGGADVKSADTMTLTPYQQALHKEFQLTP